MNTAPIVSKAWSFCTTPSPPFLMTPKTPIIRVALVGCLRSWRGQPTPPLTRHPSEDV